MKLLSKLFNGLLSISLIMSLSGLSIANVAYAEDSGANNDGKDELSLHTNGDLYSPEEVRKQVESGGIVNLVNPTTDPSRFDVFYRNNARTALPSSWDLRSQNKVTSVKSQSPFGSCWTFGANAAAETSIASSLGIDASSLDFSEHQTAWFGYTPLSNDSTTLEGTAKSQAGEGTTVTSDHRMNVGGNSTMAAAMFAQGIGVSAESEIPYNSAAGDRSSSADWSVDNSKRNNKLAILKSYDQLASPIVWDKGGYTSFTYSTDNLNKIKQALVDGKAIEISYYADQSLPGASGDGTYFNYTNYAQYVDTYKQANHSVTIVGYDDNYSIDKFNSDHKPANPGAFIVKNSWGSINSSGNDRANWGIDGSGYFYLSYYDQSLESASTFEFYTDNWTGSNLDADTYQIDQYDYMQPNNFQMLSGNPNLKFANAYNMTAGKQLDILGTYSHLENATITFDVYKLNKKVSSASDLANIETNNEGHETVSGTFENKGWHTLKLNNSMKFTNDDNGKSYVVTTQIKSGSNSSIPIPFQYSQSVGAGMYGTSVINNNESFMYLGSWSDFKSSSYSQSSSSSLDNFPIKAYLTNTKETPQTSYTVTFDTKGGSSISAQTVVSGGKATKPATDPTKTNYTFAGWFSDEALTQEYDFNSAVTKNITLYAKWTPNTYTITYVLDGGTNSSNNPAEYTYGTGVASFDNPTKEGYEFLGWFAESTFTTRFTQITSTQSGNVTLYAKWKAKEYTITYVLDGGTNSSNNPAKYTYGVGVSSFEAPTKTNYKFGGWFIDPTFLSPVKAISPTYKQNITLYAKWTEIGKHTVSFSTNGGSAVASQEVVDGQKATKPTNDPTKANYVFGGWFSDEALTQEYDFNSAVTSNITLYAKWTGVKFNITYHLDAGVTLPEGALTQYEYGTSNTLPRLSSGNYREFNGWRTVETFSADYVGIIEYGIDSAGAFVSGDIDLYPCWEYIPMDNNLSMTIKYILGNNADLKIRLNCELSMYQKFTIDGSEIDANNYLVESGSTLITLKQDYLETLAVGEHSMTVYFNDGISRLTLNIANENDPDPDPDPVPDPDVPAPGPSPDEPSNPDNPNIVPENAGSMTDNITPAKASAYFQTANLAYTGDIIGKILPILVILIIAAVAVIGYVVYKRKKK